MTRTRLRCQLLGFVLATLVAATLRSQEAPEWQFAPGDVSEPLVVTPDARPAVWSPVALPHRVQQPNRALWYRATLALPDGSALHVDADDGAQVFVGGQQWRQDGRTFFPPRPLAAGLYEVTVRVLNNAMTGGLRRFAIVSGPVSTAAPPDVALPAGFAPPESSAFRRRMPAAPAPCEFTLWADSQGGWATFAAIVTRMMTRPMHFSAGVGDLVNDGSDPRAWEHFVRTLAPLAQTTPVVPIPGNHDYDGFYERLDSRWFRAVFQRPVTWTAWTCGPARFVGLDINGDFPIGIPPGSAQDLWLRREVASAAWRDASWRILLVHQPPYSVSWAGYGGDDAVRSIVRPLVERHRLDLVVSGHSHAYEHLVRRVSGRRLDVLITGGAGGGLEAPTTVPAGDRVVLEHHFIRARADRQRLAITAESPDGRVLDHWERSGHAF